MVVEFEGKRHVLINPRIIFHSEDMILIREGCLSFFEYRGEVPRYRAVTVMALDKQGAQYELCAEDEFSSLLQHEIDHLDGILYIDRLPEGEKSLVLDSSSVPMP